MSSPSHFRHGSIGPGRHSRQSPTFTVSAVHLLDSKDMDSHCCTVKQPAHFKNAHRITLDQAQGLGLRLDISLLLCATKKIKGGGKLPQLVIAACAITPAFL